MAKLFENENKTVESQVVVSNAKEDSMKDNEISFKLGDVDCFEDRNTIWFKLADIGKILELSDSSVRLMKHDKWFDDDELCVKNTNTSEIISVKNSNTSLGRGYVMYVSESALYRILNRSNSPKAKPFERWVTKEVIPSIRKTGSYTVPAAPQKTELEIRNETRQLMNEAKRLKLEEAAYWTKLAEKYSHNKDYSQILDAYSTKALEGKFILPLPEIHKPLYSAGEVGRMLGISANKVGRIAKEFNLKTEQYGKWFMDKSPYSAKQVESFRYNDCAVEFIRSKLSE